MTPVQGSPFASGNGGFGLSATPARTKLYVSEYGSKRIGGYDISGPPGGLIPVSGSPFAAPQPVLSAVTPDGHFLYVANDAGDSDPGSVTGYSISFDGSLHPVPGSPYVASDLGPYGVAISPDARYVYVSNTGNSPSENGSVSAYKSSRRDGSLTELQGSPYTVGVAAGGIALTPDGKRLYVANGESDSISAFKRDAGTGQLTQLAASPFAVSDGEPTGVVITPDGQHLYVAVGSMVSQEDNVVDGFSITPTGQLRRVAGAPYAAGLGPQLAALSNDGKSLYVTNNGSQDISGYRVAGNGSLAPLPGAPFATGQNPLGITVPRVPVNDFTIKKVDPYGRAKAKMKFAIPGPGAVYVAGDGVRKRHRTFRSLTAGLVVEAKGSKKRKLLRRGKVTVKVDASFLPFGGEKHTKTQRVTLVKR